MKTLSGSIVALVTPFTGNNSIDYSALDRLVDFHIDSGTSGILYNGTTGESPTISLTEFKEIGEFIVNKVNGRIPVIAGVGENDTWKAINKIKIAESVGVDFLLAVSPAYNKPSNKGLILYYDELSRSTDLPIIIYNVPGRTGSNIPIKVILEIARQNANIVGVKEASGNMDNYIDLIHYLPNGFLVFAGDDNLALPLVLMGGQGCISVVANQIPEQFSSMLNLAKRGEVKKANDIYYKYLPLMNANFVETNPIPVKTSLAMMGFCKPIFRSPLCSLEIHNQEKLYKMLESYELLLRRIPVSV